MEEVYSTTNNSANFTGVYMFDAKLVPNKPGKTNWVERAGGLPKFIADIAGDLISERGMTTSRAIATAVNRVKKWAAGLDGASPKTKAKAVKALAEWERKKKSGKIKLSDALEVNLAEVDFYIDLGIDDIEQDQIKQQEYKMSEEDITASEIYCSDGSVELGEDGLIWKEVLRTGTWKYRPGVGQIPVPKPLQVVAGKSDNPVETIGLQDIVESFKDKAVEHPTIPTGHSNKVQENTGFVEKLKLITDDGGSRLVAGLKFTEDDIKKKVENGTIANTSVGLKYNYIRKEDGRQFPIVLDHVALTNSPWINGMKPFGLSEEDEEEDTGVIMSYEIDPEVTEEETPPNSEEKLNDGDNNAEETNDDNAEETATSGAKDSLSTIEDKTHKESDNMSHQIEGLAGLELSDEVRESVERILQEKDSKISEAETKVSELSEVVGTYTAKDRERQVDDRIEELKGLGLSETPGFLKVIRQLLLADSGDEVGTIMLSEEGKEEKEEKITLSDAVNTLLDSLPKKDGKINFGEQVESLGITDDEKPPVDTKDENKTAEDRYEAASEFLYGQKPQGKG